MLTAAVDVGSNTIRVLIGSFSEGNLIRVYSDRKVTRLASGLKDTGYLKRENIESSLEALKIVSELIKKYDVREVKAVGTAALRNALNSSDLIERVFKETGIRIEIITGEEEAELTIRGVLLGLELSGPSLIVDIGGGSTEWVIHDTGKSDGSSYRGSMPVGVVNLFEDFIRTDPPSVQELSALEAFTGKYINNLKENLSENNIETFVGTGGTLTTLAAIDLSLSHYEAELVHGHCIGFNRLKEIMDELVSVPLKLRSTVKGLELERADLIIPGIILTIKIMDTFKFDELIVSDYGLLEGLIVRRQR